MTSDAWTRSLPRVEVPRGPRWPLIYAQRGRNIPDESGRARRWAPDIPQRGFCRCGGAELSGPPSAARPVRREDLFNYFIHFCAAELLAEDSSTAQRRAAQQNLILRRNPAPPPPPLPALHCIAEPRELLDSNPLDSSDFSIYRLNYEIFILRSHSIEQHKGIAAPTHPGPLSALLSLRKRRRQASKI